MQERNFNKTTTTTKGTLPIIWCIGLKHLYGVCAALKSKHVDFGHANNAHFNHLPKSRDVMRSMVFHFRSNKEYINHSDTPFLHVSRKFQEGERETRGGKRQIQKWANHHNFVDSCSHKNLSMRSSKKKRTITASKQPYYTKRINGLMQMQTNNSCRLANM